MKMPTLLDYPEFATARKRHDALKAEKRTKDAELAKLRDELEEAQVRRWSRSRLDTEARARLQGVAAEADVERPLQERVAALAHDVSVLERAVALSYAELQQIRAVVSRQICAKLAGEWRKLVQTDIQAARAHAETSRAKADFRAALQALGADPITFEDIPTGDLGRLDNPNSLISGALIQAHYAGMVSLAELSPATRERATPRPRPSPTPLSIRSPRTKVQRMDMPLEGGTALAPSAVQIS
jgi:hypothetical protein